MLWDDKIIAEAAIGARPNSNSGQLDAEIAAKVGLPVLHVREKLRELVSESFLKVCATPAINIAAGDVPLSEHKMWYEKGLRWGQLSN